MLGKLLKYDLKSMFKYLVIFYLLSFLFSILARVFLQLENSMIVYIFGEIFRGAAISMMFSIIINNLMRLWVRCRQNLYGDESYLMHTLPVEKSALYLSKVLTGVITMFTSVCVVVMAFFIAFGTEENLLMFKNMFLFMSDTYGGAFWVMVAAVLFLLFLEFLNALQCGFSGIIIGHRSNNAKTGLSVLAGFLSFLASQAVTALMLFVVAVFNDEVMQMFLSMDETITLSTARTVIIAAIVIYSLVLLMMYFINVKIFKKGVNVD